MFSYNKLVGAGFKPAQKRPALHGIGSTGDRFQFANDPVEFVDDGAVALQGAYAKPGSLRRKGEDVPTTIHGPVSSWWPIE